MSDHTLISRVRSLWERFKNNGEFQGSLRFAPLDLNLLSESISKDLKETGPRVKASLAVTCLDQHGDSEFANKIGAAVGLKVNYQSYGPDRDDIWVKGASAKRVA